MKVRSDVVIVGGGVIGSAVAYNLKTLCRSLSVIVVERDPTYRTASSALSASSIRQQFSTPLNMAMSRYGMTFLKEIAHHLAVDDEEPDVGLVERGYLYLATEEGRDVLKRNNALQRAHGVNVELLTRDQLQERFAWLSTDDLAGGSLGVDGEGWFDGYSLLQAFRRKARSLGADYRTGEVVALETAGDHVDAVVLADGTRIACAMVVNAAGPAAGSVARMAGVELPVYAEKRCVFVFDCRDAPRDCPLVIDPSGVYFRPEGQLFIAGAPAQDPANGGAPGLEVDYELFDDLVWPALASRVPAFESIKLTNAWAGYYETNAFDHNAVLGAAPGLANLYLANGFSGHGMQQAPAAGRGLAEVILFGGYRTLDLSALGFDRLLRNQPIRELNVI